MAKHQSDLRCLTQSPRCRTTFRRIRTDSGRVYLGHVQPRRQVDLDLDSWKPTVRTVTTCSFLGHLS